MTPRSPHCLTHQHSGAHAHNPQETIKITTTTNHENATFLCQRQLDLLMDLMSYVAHNQEKAETNKRLQNTDCN